MMLHRPVELEGVWENNRRLVCSGDVHRTKAFRGQIKQIHLVDARKRAPSRSPSQENGTRAVGRNAEVGSIAVGSRELLDRIVGKLEPVDVVVERLVAQGCGGKKVHVAPI
jgi:hypothetical protein